MAKMSKIRLAFEFFLLLALVVSFVIWGPKIHAKDTSTPTDNSMRWYYEGKRLADQAHFEEALELFKKSVEVNPQLGKAHLMLGVIYMQIGLFDKSEQALNTALSVQIDQENKARAQYNLGALYLNHLHNAEKAIEHFQASLDAGGKNYTEGTDLYPLLSELYIQIHEWDKAIVVAKAAVNANPKSAENFYHLASVFHSSGRYKDAYQSVLKSLDLDSNYTKSKDLKVSLEEESKRRFNGDFPENIYASANEKKNGIIKEDEKYNRFALVEYRDGVRHGMYRKYECCADTLEYEVRYENGQRQGSAKSYYYDGKLEQECQYVDDQLHGKCTGYFRNGQIGKEFEYVHGLIQGPYKDYYETGQLQYIQHYVDNKKEGPYKWYHPDGSLSLDCKYINDKMDGECRGYYEDGSLQSESLYKEGAHAANSKWYYPDGKLKKEEIFENGKKIAENTYYENQQLVSHLEYDDKNIVIVWKEFFDDGRLKREMKNGKFVDYDEQREDEEEMKELTDLIDQGKADAQTYFGRGAYYHSKGEWDKAIADYNKALELPYPAPGIYEMRGVAYMEKGDLEKAIEDLTSSVHTMCCQPHQLMNIAEAHLRHGDFDKTMEYAKMLLQMQPDFPVANFFIAQAYKGKGDFQKAISLMTQAITQKPDEAQNYIIRADAYFVKQDLEKCWQDFEKAKYLGFKLDKENENRLKFYLDPKFMVEMNNRLEKE